MKLLIGVFCVMFLIGCAQESVKSGGFGQEFWEGETFVQKSVDASKLDENLIRAKVDGKWNEYELVDLPDEFIKWSTSERMESLEKIKTGEMPGLAGAHNGIIATYGYQREDSKFKVNNAVKGCGFLPKKEKIKEIIQHLEDTKEEHFMKKLDILLGNYENADSLFDMTKQVSLELYSVPDHGTQTFVNQMTEPVSVIVFMAIPTFKLKTIAYLLHPENPDLTDYEKDVVEYINLIHSYFHGEFSKEFIAVIYNVIEVYNSSPGRKEGMGKKMVP